MTRNDELARIVHLYFDGLRRKDLAEVPWAEDVKLRAPLAEGGAEVPLDGRETVRAYLTGILPVIAAVEVEDCYVNLAGTAVMGKAVLTLVTGARLRVADLFVVDAEGQITEQENHYDPRPALG